MIAVSGEMLHRLVEELPEAELPTAARFLAVLRAGSPDLLTWSLDHALEAPPEEDELGAIAEARAAMEAGSRTYSLQEVRRDLDL